MNRVKLVRWLVFFLMMFYTKEEINNTSNNTTITNNVTNKVNITDIAEEIGKNWNKPDNPIPIHQITYIKKEKMDNITKSNSLFLCGWGFIFVLIAGLFISLEYRNKKANADINRINYKELFY